MARFDGARRSQRLDQHLRGPLCPVTSSSCIPYSARAFAVNPFASGGYGRKPLLLIGALTFALLTYPAFVVIRAQPSLAKLTVVQSSFGL
jgi:hypothetical protein